MSLASLSMQNFGSNLKWKSLITQVLGLAITVAVTKGLENEDPP